MGKNVINTVEQLAYLDDLLIEKIEEVEEVKKESKDLEEVLKVKDVSHQVSLIFERIHL
jgi:hypothetical protein